MADILIAECDDWQALYIDGETVMQGHSLRTLSILNALEDKTVESVESRWYGNIWELYGRSDFPGTVEELNELEEE